MEVPRLLIKSTLAFWTILPVRYYILFLYPHLKSRQAGLERVKPVAELVRNRSLSTPDSEITEHFLPPVNAYSCNPNSLSFLGSPINGADFEKGRIDIVESKSAESKLPRRQKRMRELIMSRKADCEMVLVS